MTAWPLRRSHFWWILLILPPLMSMPGLENLPPGRLFKQLDQEWYAIAFQLRGSRPGPKDPLILAIDSESLALAELMDPKERASSPLLAQMGPWPWPRALQAELAAHALERGAHQVVFNIVFSAPSRYGPDDDAAFFRRLKPWRQQVVLAASFERFEDHGVEQMRMLSPRWAWPRVGLSTIMQTDRGQVAAIPGERWTEMELSAFPASRSMALAYAAASIRPIRLPLGINFLGPAGEWPSVPAWSVPEQADEIWQGRTVLIGATAPELGDQQESPFGVISGTELQAAALATVQFGTGFRSMPSPLSLSLLVLWTAVAGVVLHQCRSASRILLISLTLALLAVLITGLAWGVLHIWLPLTVALSSVLIAGGGKAGIAWHRESRERADLHKVLARRISPKLLRDILREPTRLGTQLGGQRKRCVVLFTDLVGFTSLSAQLKPEELFALLNRYFDGLSKAVLAEDGLLDKFIGDALMAEFGVPRSRGDQQEAFAAVRTALAMQSSLEILNEDLQSKGQPCLRQGIGLHVGDVIAGNLGSVERLEFTVIGATVNVASRLESLTRKFPEHPILISSELRELLGSAVDVVDLGDQIVKGWPNPLKVYALNNLKT